MTAVVSVKIREIQFEGQTKAKLGSVEVKRTFNISNTTLIILVIAVIIISDIIWMIYKNKKKSLPTKKLEWLCATIVIIYPLFIIPLGIVGVTTTYNFLAGLNGLEAGQGIILVSVFSLVAYMTGSYWLALVGLCMIASLFAFMLYNFYPAKIFPGDSLTYTVGGMLGIMAILGNFEKIAVFFFIPFVIEFFLKARGKFVKQSFGEPKKDGSLTLRYEKIYSLNHVAIKLMEKAGIKPTERKVVLSIWLFQIAIIVVGFFIFKRGIFG